MLFNSLHFLIFFPTIVVLFFACPQRFRWLLLLCASYYFYMCWKAEYALLIIASTLLDYFVGLLMGRAETRAGRKKYLMISLIGNLGILFMFKYFNFFNEAFRTVFARLNIFYDVPVFQALLPIGISFYTFQTLSYSIEVYRGKIKPERNLGIFALYVSFFPQLVAGPIERAQSLLPQFYQKMELDFDRITRGLQLMLWGMFKKVVIADRLAVMVDAVYRHPADYHGPSLFLATVLFAFQIFCDFSGYSDIAIGSAEVMGFKLMRNFNRPYHAQSISEFWQRWHISLSTWFKDYVYIPLGGNRTTFRQWVFCIVVTFLLSGMWHGANWTFVVWGLLHAIYYLGERRYHGERAAVARLLRFDKIPLLHKGLRVLVTFGLVCLAWVFFRANTLQEALYILVFMFQGWGDSVLFGNGVGALGVTAQYFVISILLLIFMEGVHLAQHLRGEGLRERFARRPLWLRWAAYLFLTLCVMNLRSLEEIPFIYFQF